MSSNHGQESAVPPNPSGRSEETPVQASESTENTAEERTQYVLVEAGGQHRWYVIFERTGGVEHFSAQEDWEHGGWPEHTPSPLEREAARKLLAQKRGQDNWEEVISIDDLVVRIVAAPGEILAPLRAAVLECKAVYIDPSNWEHTMLTKALSKQIHQGEELIVQVEIWFDLQYEYRCARERTFPQRRGDVAGETTSSEDVVTRLVPVPDDVVTPLRAALRECKTLCIDPSNEQHMALARGVREHIRQGEQLIEQLLRWFQQQDVYRPVIRSLQRNN